MANELKKGNSETGNFQHPEVIFPHPNYQFIFTTGEGRNVLPGTYRVLMNIHESIVFLESWYLSL